LQHFNDACIVPARFSGPGGRQGWQATKNFPEKFLTTFTSAPEGWQPWMVSHKKFPGEIFDDVYVGPGGVAAMDGKSQKIACVKSLAQNTKVLKHH